MEVLPTTNFCAMAPEGTRAIKRTPTDPIHLNKSLIIAPSAFS
jgi:hypothetical protein